MATVPLSRKTQPWSSIHQLIDNADWAEIPTENFYLEEAGSAKPIERGLALSADAIISTLTYYNAFSLAKWKKYTDVSEIDVSVQGEGEVTVDTFTARVPQSDLPLPKLAHAFDVESIEETLVFSTRLDLDSSSQTVCRVNVKEQPGEMLFFRVRAHRDSRIHLFELSLHSELIKSIISL